MARSSASSTRLNDCCCSIWVLTCSRRFVAYAAPRISDAERKAHLDAWEVRILEAASRPVDRSKTDLRSALTAIGAGAWGRQASRATLASG